MSHAFAILIHQLNGVFNATMTILFYEVIKNYLRKRDDARRTDDSRH